MCPQAHFPCLSKTPAHLAATDDVADTAMHFLTAFAQRVLASSKSVVRGVPGINATTHHCTVFMVDEVLLLLLAAVVQLIGYVVERPCGLDLICCPGINQTCCPGV